MIISDFGYMSRYKYFRDLPLESRIQFIKDVLLQHYPFTKDDLDDFQDKLNFKTLSSNQFIDWNAELIERHHDRWDWFEIENNPIVCKEVNLGLLYPDKVNILKPECQCHKMLDFCSEKKHCTGMYDDSKMSKPNKRSINPKLAGFIKFLFEDYPFGPSLLNCVFQYNLLINQFDDYELENLEMGVDSLDNSDVPF